MAIKIPKLRVAVAGTSFGGVVQIPVFQSHPRTEVVALSSGRAERAKQTAQDAGIPSYYTSFEQMLDKEKPDIVSIVTPPDLHSPMTMAALHRGIHVLCEKPFALNLDEARRMKLAADNAKVVAMIDYEFRFTPGRAYAAELLRQKYVGEIRMMDFTVHIGARSYAEDAEWNWWCDETRGGGLLGAFGSHAADLLWCFLGPPRRVFCDLVTFVKERNGKPVTADDGYSLIVEFQSGARAAVQMTNAAGVRDARLGIYGTEGQLVIPNLFATELHGGERSAGKTGVIEIPEQYQLPRDDQPLRPAFRALLNRMVEAIDDGLPSPSPNFIDAVNGQAVLDAARRSTREGTWIEVES